MKTLKISGKRQLFVDDYIVDETRNLKRILHQPTKFVGNPIIMPFSPWEGHTVSISGTVMYDQGIYRMWYAGMGGTPYSAHYATSKDGIYWEKPDLGLIEYNGNKNNNLFISDISTPMVIKDPQEDNPDRLYKSIFYEALKPFTSVAFSPDGIHWTKYEGNPIRKNETDTHNLLGWDESFGKYVAYIRPPLDQKENDRVRTLGRSVSDDFINWSNPVTVLRPDEKDPPGTEFYYCPVFKYQGVYFGLPSVYYVYLEEPKPRMGGLIDVQLAISRDGINWERTEDRKPFIPRGGPGSVDSAKIYTAKEPLIMGDELWFYYGGGTVDHGITHDPLGRPAYPTEDGPDKHDYWGFSHLIAQRGSTINLAKLRLDGFISMDATEEEGYLITKAFICENENLFINAYARGGQIVVAVLDEAGQHIGDYYTGFKKIDCAPFDSDSLRHKVTWKDYISLASLKGKTIRLKFYLRNANLYSFELKR